MRKKRIAMLLTVSMVIAMLSGCGGNSDSGDSGSSGTDTAAETEKSEEESGSASEDYVYRVGFINIDNADQNCYPAAMNFKEYVESMEFAKAVGTDKVEAMVADSALDIEKQTTNVETMLTKGVDMMFIIGVDTEGNTAAVEQCNAEGVPVFMEGTEASGGEWKFVGFNETELGQKVGEWCVGNLPENAEICFIEGTPGREAAVLRKQGFMDAVAQRKDLDILSSQTGEFEVEASMHVTEDWLTTYGDKITCIAGTDNNAVLGASQAIAAANMKGKILTCGVIGNRDDAEMIKNDECSYGVFVYWPAIGTLCGEIAQQQYLGEEIPERSHIELFDMTKENCDELLDEYCTE